MARILYFGKLSDVTGSLSEELPLPAGIADTEALRGWLDTERGFGGALLHKSIRLAVNGDITAGPAPVSDTDEIALMPPVGGG